MEEGLVECIIEYEHEVFLRSKEHQRIMII